MAKLTLYDKFSIISIFLIVSTIVCIIPSFTMAWWNYTQTLGMDSDAIYRLYLNKMTFLNLNTSVSYEADPRDIGFNNMNQIVLVSYVFNILMCLFAGLTLMVVVLHRVFFVRNFAFSCISRYTLIIVFCFSVCSTYVPRLMAKAITNDCNDIWPQGNSTDNIWPTKFCNEMNQTAAKYFTNSMRDVNVITWGLDIGWSFSPIVAPMIILAEIVLYLSEPLYGCSK